MSEQKEAKKTLLNRRQFLIVLGTGGAVALGVKLGMPLLHRGIATMMEGASVPFGMDAEPSIWFEIRPDNRVALYIPKVEMGQGIHTALGQIGAEELEVRWEDLQVEQAGTGIGLDDSMGTSGSSSVSSLYQPLREAGALMREMLLQEAAVQTGISPDQLVAADGAFSGAGVQLTYGEVVANKTGEWKIPKDIPPLKPAKNFKFIGQSMRKSVV